MNLPIKNQRGFVLITTTMIMSLLLLLAIYLVTFTITELRISNSQSTATKTYYLAESGIAEAIWRIKNDPVWKNDFETNPNWSLTYTRQPALYPNGSYQIEINNTGHARGEIIATGFINLGQSTAQRVIKVIAYKALGESIIGDHAEYADGNIDLSGSLMNVYNGSVFSNNNIIVNFWSTFNVDGMVRATGNVLKHHNSVINASGIEAANYGNPPAPLPMPAISFDDPNDPNSYKNRADAIYTKNEFENLMWNNPNLTLDGITYVTGDIDIRGAQNLTINGVLVSDRDITVGKNTLFCCWGWRCGHSEVVINQTSSTSPAGLLAKRKINFELCFEDFYGKGLVYANDQLNILSLPKIFDLTGGMISRKLTLTSIWQGLNLTFNNEVISYTLGDPRFAPVVTVEHWEEKY